LPLAGVPASLGPRLRTASLGPTGHASDLEYRMAEIEERLRDQADDADISG
jgi:hypothetical protein